MEYVKKTKNEYPIGKYGAWRTIDDGSIDILWLLRRFFFIIVVIYYLSALVQIEIAGMKQQSPCIAILMLINKCNSE